MLTRFHILLLRLAAIVAHKTDTRVLEMATRGLSRVFPKNRHAQVLVGSGIFSFELSDHYWARLLDPREPYEKEIHAVFELVSRAMDFGFVDAGANKGYWSVFAGGSLKDPSRVIAIEATPATYNELIKNAALNKSSFTSINAAVYSTDGLPVTITTIDGEHAGASIKNAAADASRRGHRCSSTVNSITLDSVSSSFPPGLPVFVKLDVEGVEIEAIQGASQTLVARDTLFAYEDHGADISNRTTAFILERGLRIYFISDREEISLIQSADELQEIKSSRYRGYNFFATQPDSAFDILLSRLLDPGSAAAQ